MQGKDRADSVTELGRQLRTSDSGMCACDHPPWIGIQRAQHVGSLKISNLDLGI